MTTSHIDQLAEWWENAEEGEAAPGDWIITHGPDDTNPAYIVEQAPRYPLSSKRQPYRILARAPKPKPAWHDAVAVIARTGDFGLRRVFVRDGDGVWNEALSGRGIRTSGLRDVTPLIEAKVTDEMVERGARAAWASEMGGGWGSAWEDEKDITRRTVRLALAAALGIDTTE